MTNEELKSIRARAEKATPGPWTCSRRSNQDDDSFVGHDLEERLTAERGQIARWADAEFIAHVREDIPNLLEEIQNLKELIEHAWDDGYDVRANNGAPIEFNTFKKEHGL